MTLHKPEGRLRKRDIDPMRGGQRMAAGELQLLLGRTFGQGM